MSTKLNQQQNTNDNHATLFLFTKTTRQFSKIFDKINIRYRARDSQFLESVL